MNRFVLDTNVVLDLFHWGNTEVFPIMKALQSRQIDCYANPETLGELHRVLAYPQLRLSEQMQHDRFKDYSELVYQIPLSSTAGMPPWAPLPRCRDKDDQKFLLLAQMCHANYLVSRDKALLKVTGRSKLPFKIIHPSQMSAVLQLISEYRASA